ncbi:MAG: tetratricopeptide repeat protein [bacterium]|nr:tetratricopeptide repeat protein [bacterium]
MRVVFLLAMFLVAVGGRAAEVAPHARKKAEQFDRWRETLEHARSAEAADRDREAERLYRSVIEESRTEDLLTARAVDGLADLYRRNERWVESEPLYRRSVEMWTRLLGAEQPRLAATLHNLGMVLSYQGRHEDARAALERALAIWNAATGVDSDEATNTRRALDRLP